MCIHGLIYTHTFPSSVHQEDLEEVTPRSNEILHVQILISEYHCPIEGTGLLDEMPDSVFEAGKVQDEPKASYTLERKEVLF